MAEINQEEQILWNQAREWAVAEVLAKHYKELKESQSKHFKRLTSPKECLCKLNSDGMIIEGSLDCPVHFR